MDISEIWEKYGPALKQYMAPILLGTVGFVFLLYGLIAPVLPKNNSEDIVFESAQGKAEAVAGKESSVKQIAIDIEGAVLKPGVYKLPADARVQDALIAAGGLTDTADREKVAKSMNLAGKIIDGGKIYIPFLGDTSGTVQSGVSGANQAVMGDSSGGLININSASTQELDTLSGVGPATAEKIIANRPYEKIEDLLSKKSVGQSVFGKIKDRISTY